MHPGTRYTVQLFQLAEEPTLAGLELDAAGQGSLATDAAAAVVEAFRSRAPLPLAADVRDSSVWRGAKPLVTGALTGMTATVCTQPLDCLKVRVQVAAAAGKPAAPLTILSDTLRHEGLMVLYKGLSAGLTRQVIYTGGCFGLFDMMTEKLKDPAFDSVPGFAKKLVSAFTAGGMAAAAGNPADLALIRMQADSLLPPEQRRDYRGVGHAMTTIARNEGVLGLFKGGSITTTRAMAAAFGTLAVNAQAKEALQEMGAHGPACTTGGSLIAGFAASFLSLPFDFVKTQVQKMRANPVTGKMPYSGPLDCVAKQLQAGGVLRFWAGFPTYYATFAPRIGIALVVQDQIKSMWKTFGV